MHLTVPVAAVCSAYIKILGKEPNPKEAKEGSYFSTAEFGLIAHLECIYGFALLFFSQQCLCEVLGETSCDLGS